MSDLGAIARLFLKLGAIGFGGPAAHIAMMEDEVVTRRRWLSREQFLDLVGATNLIPGPNSTEMAIHVGFARGGVPGLILSGACFLAPAIAITLLFAWIYVSYGTLPQVAPLLYGIKPAVLAIVAGALWKLGKKALKTRQLVVIAVVVAGLLFWGLNEVIALFAGGLVGMLWIRFGKAPSKETTRAIASGVGIGTALKAIAAAPAATVTPSLWQLGLFFLKVGCVLFGSGYVLVAFLEGEVVGSGWMTQQQLLDAIAIGQFTPGPVLSTATFIGYVVAGAPGALVATVGIFFPSFVFVAALNPLVPRLRRSAWTAAFLDAVNASAVALMAVVTVQLALAVLLQPLDWAAIAIAVVAAVALFRFKLGSVWLVLGGALLGGLAGLAGVAGG